MAINWQSLRGRGKAPHRTGLGHFVIPRAVVELEPDFVMGARLEPAALRVAQVTVQELPPGTFLPQVQRAGLAGREGLPEAVDKAITAVGNGNGKLGLLVPDGSVRVAVFEFETLPGNPREIEQMVRWKMRDILPFPDEEIRLSYQIMRDEPGAIDLLVVGARSSVLAEFESILAPGNGGVSLILPVTLGLVALVPAAQEKAQLLLHVCAGWMTTVIVAGDRIRFWRNRSLDRGNDGELAAEVGREAARVQASCRDHLQLEVGGVWLCVRPPVMADLGATLREMAGLEVHTLEAPASMLGALSAWEQSVCAKMGTPLAGLLANASLKP